MLWKDRFVSAGQDKHIHVVDMSQVLQSDTNSTTTTTTTTSNAANNTIASITNAHYGSVYAVKSDACHIFPMECIAR